MRTRTLQTFVAGLALVCGGCPGGGGGGGASEAEIAAYQQRLELAVDGAEARVPLERLNVFLVEDEDAWPEIFELEGAGCMLVGEFPRAIHVGYSDRWEQLVGQRIPIAAEGGDPREPKTSAITLDGKEIKVRGGWFQVAHWRTGFDAKTPLEGELELELEDGRTLRGKMFVLGTTWG